MVASEAFLLNEASKWDRRESSEETGQWNMIPRVREGEMGEGEAEQL